MLSQQIFCNINFNHFYNFLQKGILHTKNVEVFNSCLITIKYIYRTNLNCKEIVYIDFVEKKTILYSTLPFLSCQRILILSYVKFYR